MALSAMYVDRMGLVFFQWAGGWEKGWGFFLAIYGEGPSRSRKEACVPEGATVLGAVSHSPFKFIGTLIFFFF